MGPYTHLKSGTDVRGVALPDGGRAVTLTPAAAGDIARAFARWLRARTGQTAPHIAVGRDSRLSGPPLRDAVAAALVGCGARVWDCGLASTPAMFMTTVQPADGVPPMDGAIQLTASHHPFDRNGMKFFTPAGGLEGADIAAILELAAEADGGADTPGEARDYAYMDAYAAYLRGMIREGIGGGERPLAGWRIVVDAGGGAGGFYARDVLAPLGADVSGSIWLEPDGHFPGHIPNPEDAAAMRAVSGATLAAGADFGIIFDTDVDRAGCVDAAGREIGRNRLIALAAAIVLEDSPGGTVVTDSVTSDGLKAFIEGLGGVHRRFRRGYRNVINEAVRLNGAGTDAPLAIETSGHAALRENRFLDDGAYLVTRILIRLARLRREGRTLDDLIGTLREPAETAELRLDIAAADFAACGQRVLEALEAHARAQGWAVAEDSAEGVRIRFPAGAGDGWLLLRLSVHDPVMPLNIESNRVGGCREQAAHVWRLLAAQEGLDVGGLRRFVGVGDEV